MKILYALFFILIYVCNINAQNVSILATGEIHGVLSNCDCPDNPGGGLASIYTVFKKFKNDSTLFLDAGGFSAGGIYDLNTDGKKCDSIKTGLVFEAISIVGYDAVGVGDDELQYDPMWLKSLAKQYQVNLISANILDKDSAYIFNRYSIITKGDVKFLITSFVTDELILNNSSKVIISDPLDELNDLLEDVKEDWDQLVILSHLGESKSRIIFENQNNFNLLIVNGHKKIITEPGEINEKNVLMQFGFQGKTVSKIELNIKDKKWENLAWITNDGEYKQNELITGLETIYKSTTENKKNDVYDIYLMSRCPYGLPVLNDLHEFLGKQYVNNELNVWFIGDVDSSNKFHSLHGSEEINDELLWLYVKNNYDKFWDIFISLVSSGEFTTEEAISELNIDTLKFPQWKKMFGNNILRSHYYRSNKLHINASPTLYLNNKPFEGEVNSNFIRAKECFKEKKEILKCDSLPECFDNNDCYKDGYHGACHRDSSNWGKCEYVKGEVFDFIILTSNDLIFKVDDDIINTTKSMFPAAKINKLTSKDKRFKNLINKFEVKALPFAIFSSEVQKSISFKDIEEGIVNKFDSFIFKENYVPGTLLFNRKKVSDNIKIFIDLDKVDLHLKKILIRFINSVDKSKIEIYPLFANNEGESYLLNTDLTNVKINTKINNSLNKEFNKLLDESIQEFQDIKSIKSLSKYYNSYMNEYLEIVNKKTILILINNQEIVSPHNNKEVDVILSRIISIVK